MFWKHWGFVTPERTRISVESSVESSAGASLFKGSLVESRLTGVPGVEEGASAVGEGRQMKKAQTLAGQSRYLEDWIVRKMGGVSWSCLGADARRREVWESRGLCTVQGGGCGRYLEGDFISTSDPRRGLLCMLRLRLRPFPSTC